jgi:hypothetical protein
MDEFFEFKQYVRCQVRTLDDKLITEIRVFNVPRVDEILWFSPHNGHETDVPTSYIVKEVCHWIGSFSSTMPYQKVCLYVEPS